MILFPAVIRREVLKCFREINTLRDTYMSSEFAFIMKALPFSYFLTWPTKTGMEHEIYL